MAVAKHNRISGETQVTRRRLLTAASAVVAVSAVPAAAVASDDSPLRAIYQQWQEAKDAYCALPVDCDEEADEAAYLHMVSFEEAATAYEPRTMEDMAFKIIFADDNGDMDMNLAQIALAELAYRITGITPRHDKARTLVGGVA